MMWDVLGGVARRAWSRCDHSIEVSTEVNEKYKGDYHITLPYIPDEGLVESVVDEAWKKKDEK
jgi:urocanate hydratase